MFPNKLCQCQFIPFLDFGCFIDLSYLSSVKRVFGVSTLEKTAHDDIRKLASAIYLQVSIISQALIFVTRSRGWSYVERPGILLMTAFVIAQLVSLLSTYFVLLQIFQLHEKIEEGMTLVIDLVLADCYIDCGICELELCCH